MPTAIPASTSARALVPSRKSTGQRTDMTELVPIALFSGMGLLVSLVAILLGVQGGWY